MTPSNSAPQIEYKTNPFTVIIDSREQAPYSFTGLQARGDKKKRPLVVPTTIKGLKTGDYSIDGLESRISIERKSLSDLYSTLGQDRERFEREFVRLNQLDCAYIIVESGLAHAINSPPPNSKLNPISVYGTVIDWQIDYPRVHWWFCESRTFAEKTTFRILERFWRIEQELLKGV